MDTIDHNTELEPSVKPSRSVGDWLLLALGAAGALLFVAFVAYLIFMAVLLSSFSTPYTDREELPFTPEAWAAAEDDWHGARYLMLDDLRAKHPLIGRTRAEVETLLGPLIPPTEYPGGVWCYYLGPEPRWAAMDNIWLELEFDSSDRIVRTGTVTD